MLETQNSRTKNKEDVNNNGMTFLNFRVDKVRPPDCTHNDDSGTAYEHEQVSGGAWQKCTRNQQDESCIYMDLFVVVYVIDNLLKKFKS